MKGEQAVRAVIGILRDGELGYRDFAGLLKDGEARAFFLEESRVRSVFAGELERMLRDATGAEWGSNGTTLGTLHRSWVDLRLTIGANDRKILETTERCEEYAVAGYDVLLQDKEVPKVVQAVVQRQAQHVRRALGLVRMYGTDSEGAQREAGGAGFSKTEDADAGPDAR